MADFISVIKDITNIIFFIVIGTIGILTYINAKKTLFAPLRTEVYKFQLSKLQEILDLVEHQHEVELMNKFDLDKCFILNAQILIDDYFTLFYPNYRKVLDDDKLPEILTEVRFSEYVCKQNEGNDYLSTRLDRPSNITDKDSLINLWKSYRYDFVYYTGAARLQLARLEKLENSPILPDSLRKKLEDYSLSVIKNLWYIGLQLTAAAPKMLDVYTQYKYINLLDEDDSEEIDWLHDIKIDKKPQNLSIKAKEIQNWIFSYLDIANLKIPNTYKAPLCQEKK